MVRMLSWVPGRVLADVKPHSRALLVSLGRALGEMDRAFEGFAHPAMNRPLQWDLARTPWINAELGRFADGAHRGIIERVVARFESHAIPLLTGMRRQVIHNDWNDHNVIVANLPVFAASGVGQSSSFAIALPQVWGKAPACRCFRCGAKLQLCRTGRRRRGLWRHARVLDRRRPGGRMCLRDARQARSDRRRGRDRRGLPRLAAARRRRARRAPGPHPRSPGDQRDDGGLPVRASARQRVPADQRTPCLGSAGGARPDRRRPGRWRPSGAPAASPPPRPPTPFATGSPRTPGHSHPS